MVITDTAAYPPWRPVGATFNSSFLAPTRGTFVKKLPRGVVPCVPTCPRTSSESQLSTGDFHINSSPVTRVCAHRMPPTTVVQLKTTFSRRVAVNEANDRPASNLLIASIARIVWLLLTRVLSITTKTSKRPTWEDSWGSWSSVEGRRIRRGEDNLGRTRALQT